MRESSGPRPLALRVRGLGFRVGGVNILSDIDLEIEEGSFLGIIGPNGAGKTTLLNLLSGLLKPTDGVVELFGRDLARVSSSSRAGLGMGRTFQTSSLFNSLSVLENARLSAQARLGGSMKLWQRPRASDQATMAAAASLEEVGLASMAHHVTGSLSHGDKRKLELAILLAADAKVLLLDEPMAGVNTEDVPLLTTLIGRLHSEGRTVLMVEHHMAVVVGLAQDVAVLDYGRLLACGTPEEVMANESVQAAYLGDPL
ncbi:MAG: ABC transporter ATP-binding protein [Acidimicrobiales bacterium]